MSSQKLNYRQVRWALYLFRFNFTLKHVPGSSMGKADSLSRQPDWQKEVEKDNENRALLKKEWLEAKVIQVAKVMIDEIDLLEKMRESKTKDNEVVKAVKEMK